MTSGQIILLTPPAQPGAAGQQGLPLGVMGYRLGRNGLLKSRYLTDHQGDWLVVDDLNFTESSLPPEEYVRQILSEQEAGCYEGILLNWEGTSPLLREIATLLNRELERQERSLMLPPAFSAEAPQGIPVCSGHIYQGDLARMLRTILSHSGGRGALAAERRAREFLLPEDKTGRPLTPGELARLRELHRPPVYFSNELCAHYFTYRDQRGLHQVIFDTEGSLRRQVLLARQMGASLLLAWPEVRGMLPKLLQET